MLLNPPKLVKALGFPLICLAMFSVAGGHWAILQTVAWGGMLLNYSKEAGSIVTGAEKTFSGQYPCEMCRKVVEGKKKEEQLPVADKVNKKAEKIFVAFSNLVALPSVSDFCFPIKWETFWTRSEAPPV